MANYEPIPFSKEAAQIPVYVGDAPPTASTLGDLYQIYRDTQGHYTLVNTINGTQRANELDWLMLEQDIVPLVPAVPAVIGTFATGLYVVAGAAAGDGVVGFDYNGIVYAVSPTAADTAAVTAQALVELLNLGGQATAVLSVESVVITSNVTGVAENITLIDVTTDTVQTGAESGMSGGTDTIPSTPEIPEQPAILSVWTDAKFNELYQVI
jgi:hypothetical protein